MPVNSPLKWHGGKHYLAGRIVALFPPHKHYVEPYAGGLSVLLHRDPEGVSEVVNDVDRSLSNFWDVLRSDVLFPEFLRLAQATPFSQDVFDSAFMRRDHRGGDLVHWAFWFFVLCRQSLAGRMKAFAPLTRRRVRRGMNEQAAAWLTAVDGLPEVHARLWRVVVLCGDAADVIRKQDGPDTLVYADPPYVSETRAAPDVYAHEMDQAAHVTLLRTLSQMEGRFLLSGYRCALYDTWAHRMGWTRHDFDLPNNSAGGGTKRRMIESVWSN